jgi:membrane fusion protein, copper/silver efflux system
MKTTIQLFAVVAFALVAACSRTSAPLKPADVDYYTCTMHPFVHADAPGKCPVCGMELVPVKKNETTKGRDGETAKSSIPPIADSPSRFFIVPIERQQQIGVTYAKIERRPLRKEIRAVGTVEPDLQKHWAFVVRADGYVQELIVASAGQIVEKDEPLLSIYSPDLATTTRELVMLLKMRDDATTPASRETPQRLIIAAEARLQQWNITPDQIAELEKSRTSTEVITLRSPFRGVVQELPAHQGVAVKIGDHLVDVADLSTVWVWAEYYESELAGLQSGQRVSVTSKSFPDAAFEGTVAVVNPFVDQTKRTSRVRIDIPNPEFKLRPGMYADVALSLDAGERLAIPVSAVMPTGERNIAFVDKGNGKIEPRDLKLAGQFGDLYAIESGLSEGERVIASANFLIDSEAKVQGALADFARK